MPDEPYGPGSGGAPFVPSPGFAYAGDAWCMACGRYRPTERNDFFARRFAPHGCVTDRQPVQEERQHEEEGE